MSEHSQRGPRLRDVGEAMWRLDDRGYRPVKVLLNRSTGRFLFLRQPAPARPEGSERGYTYSELSGLIQSGRVTLDRGVAKGLVESGRDFGATFMSSWPTAEDVLDEIAAWHLTDAETDPAPETVSLPRPTDNPPVGVASSASQGTSHEAKSGGEVLVPLVVWGLVLVALLWSPVSDWHQSQVTRAQHGGYGLARLDAACAWTPWTVDNQEALASLGRLWQDDFEYGGRLVNDEVGRAWWQVHWNVIRAFGLEDWRSPEGTNLEWFGTDYTEAAIEIRRTWFSGRSVGPDEDFMLSWSNACRMLTL